MLSMSSATFADEPNGTITWGGHVTLTTRWLDTAETDAEITPFMVMYALHDALPEIESLFQRQLQEMDRKKREDLLFQIQRLIAERAMFVPIWENGFIRAYGPRVEEPGLTLLPAFSYSGPLED